MENCADTGLDWQQSRFVPNNECEENFEMKNVTANTVMLQTLTRVCQKKKEEGIPENKLTVSFQPHAGFYQLLNHI